MLGYIGVSKFKLGKLQFCNQNFLRKLEKNSYKTKLRKLDQKELKLLIRRFKNDHKIKIKYYLISPFLEHMKETLSSIKKETGLYFFQNLVTVLIPALQYFRYI